MPDRIDPYLAASVGDQTACAATLNDVPRLTRTETQGVARALASQQESTFQAETRTACQLATRATKDARAYARLLTLLVVAVAECAANRLPTMVALLEEGPPTETRHSVSRAIRPEMFNPESASETAASILNVLARTPGSGPSLTGDLRLFAADLLRPRITLQARAQIQEGRLSDSDEDEVVSKAIDALATRGRVEHGLRSALAYTRKVIGGQACSRLRREGGPTWRDHPSCPGGEPESPPESPRRAVRSLEAACQQVSSQLTPKQREVVSMRLIANRTYEDIAQALGCSRASARKHVQRARVVVREALPQLPRDERMHKERFSTKHPGRRYRGHQEQAEDVLLREALARGGDEHFTTAENTEKQEA